MEIGSDYDTIILFP